MIPILTILITLVWVKYFGPVWFCYVVLESFNSLIQLKKKVLKWMNKVIWSESDLIWSHYKSVKIFICLVKNIRLTVRTSIGLQPESNPTVWIPVQRNETDKAGDRRLLQLVLDHTVCVTVTWKRLKSQTKDHVLHYPYTKKL